MTTMKRHRLTLCSLLSLSASNRPLIFFLLFNGRRPTEAFEPADWELAVALAAPVKAAFIADSLRPVEIDTVSGYDSAGRR